MTVAVALPVLGLVLAPIRRRVKARSKAAAAAQLGFASAVAELGSLGLEMQTYGVRDRFAERVDELVTGDVRARRRADVLKGAAPVVYTSLAYIAMLGGLGLASVSGGDVAALGAVMLVLLRSLTYGQQLQTASVNLIQAMPFLERLDETITTYEADTASGGAARPPGLGAIELREVSFGYASDRPVLSDVSVRIERGETVGVIGPSGAGKSTLVQLLLGVRDPSTGQVLVDGIDLREVDRRWWAERVAFVAQDALLFTGTVAENVRFFRDGIDDHALQGAAARAHVLADVEALPHGFDTHLGERGSQLSGGQRQRLSIARALAGSPDVLILDEPTSALDMRSELLIRETLAELHGEKTVIVIAHRMSTLQECDRLLVVDDGRLVAEGPPAALRNENEFYRRALELSGIT